MSKYGADVLLHGTKLIQRRKTISLDKCVWEYFKIYKEVGEKIK